MTTRDQSILVTGATGNQGGATARHLLADGWDVRALVRNPASAAAQALAQAGATLVTGDMDDAASLEAAMQGVYGVFSVQSIETLVRGGVEGEIRQGTNVADAAQAAGVRHFVYASVTAAQSGTGIPNFESKGQLERYIHALGLPTTVLRPSVFMENFTLPQMGIQHGSYATAIRPDAKEYLIAADDIGALAAIAFGDPENLIGQTIDLAGDALTPAQTASAISRATGHVVTFEPISLDIMLQQNEGFARAIDFFNTHGYDADIPALRTLHPGLMTFETWLNTTGKAKFAALFNAPDA